MRLRFRFFETVFLFVVWLTICLAAIGVITALAIGLNLYRQWMATMVPDWQAWMAFTAVWIVVLLSVAFCMASMYANGERHPQEVKMPTGRVPPASPPTRELAPTANVHELPKTGPSPDEIARRGYGQRG